MQSLRRQILAAVALCVCCASALVGMPVAAQPQLAPLKLGVGMFQPDREKNDATYRPLAQHLAQRLERAVELRTVDSWEGLAKSLANGETDMALMGPWGYGVLCDDRDAPGVWPEQCARPDRAGW